MCVCVEDFFFSHRHLEESWRRTASGRIAINSSRLLLAYSPLTFVKDIDTLRQAPADTVDILNNNTTLPLLPPPSGVDEAAGKCLRISENRRESSVCASSVFVCLPLRRLLFGRWRRRHPFVPAAKEIPEKSCHISIPHQPQPTSAWPRHWLPRCRGRI